jgi:hypothetical protein
MTSPDDTIIARVHRVLGLLDGLEDADGQWLAERARRWLAGASWEPALDLSSDWRSILKHQQVDAALARLVAALGPFPSGREAGRAMERELTRYETSAYRSDRATGRRPPGTKGLLFDVLATGCRTNADWLRKNIPAVRHAEWANVTDESPHAAD